MTQHDQCTHTQIQTNKQLLTSKINIQLNTANYKIIKIKKTCGFCTAMSACILSKPVQTLLFA